MCSPRRSTSIKTKEDLLRWLEFERKRKESERKALEQLVCFAIGTIMVVFVALSVMLLYIVIK